MSLNSATNVSHHSAQQNETKETFSGMSLSTEKLTHIYHKMLYIRRFQEKTATLYQQGTMGGFCHLYTGQEAVIMGALTAAGENDEYITTYRCHAHALALGVPAGDILAELMGKATGVSKGKGGSMHMFDTEKHFWGGHGIVGGNIPLGTGMAFSMKYRGETDRATLTFFGDGASDNGALSESFNMAALWKLPCLYIVENNKYSMGTAIARHSAGALYKRSEPFGIPSEQVDGMDFFSVYEAISRALAHIKSGKGAYFLEMDTYRYRGHSMSDPAKYRTKEEVDEVKQLRDPLETMKAYLLKERGVSEDSLKQMDKEIKASVAEAEKFAKESPVASLSELYTDVLPANEEIK